MGNQFFFKSYGHSLGTDTMKLNKKGISFHSANPLNIHGAGGRNRTDMGLRPAGF